MKVRTGALLTMVALTVVAGASTAVADPGPSPFPVLTAGLPPFPHGAPVLSGDGRLAVEQSFAGSLLVLRDHGSNWDGPSAVLHLPVASFSTLDDPLALSGDGSTVAAADGATLLIWAFDGVHWNPVLDRTLDSTVSGLWLSRDGRLLTVWDGGRFSHLRLVDSAWSETDGFTGVGPGPAAVAGDGVTAVAEVPSADEGTRVFVHEPSGTWTSLGSGYDSGGRPAISRDSSTVAVLGSGAATIFRRTAAGTWARAARFTPAAASFTTASPLALSANGDTLVVGQPSFSDGHMTGAAYRYVWSGKTWHWGGFLADPLAADLGTGVAVSADGRRILVSGTYSDGGTYSATP